MIEEVSQINTDTLEGKLLVAALVIISRKRNPAFSMSRALENVNEMAALIEELKDQKK